MHEKIEELLKINPILYYNLTNEYKLIPKLYLTAIAHPLFDEGYINQIPFELKSEQKVFDIIFERKMFDMIGIMDNQIILNNLDKISSVYNELHQDLKSCIDIHNSIIARNDYYQMFFLILDGKQINITKEICFRIIESLLNRKEYDINLFTYFFENIDENLRNDSDIFLSFIDLYDLPDFKSCEIIDLFLKSNNRITTNYEIIKNIILLFVNRHEYSIRMEKYFTKEIAIKLMKDNIYIYKILSHDLKEDIDVICRDIISFKRFINIEKIKYKNNELIGKAILLGFRFNLHVLKTYSQKLCANRKFLGQSIPKYFQLHNNYINKLIDFTFFLCSKVNSFHETLKIL